MVRVGDMLHKKKSFGLRTKEGEARAMFHLHASATPGDDGTPGSGPPGVNFRMFRKIIKALIKFTNDEAVLRSSQHGQPLESRHPAPPERDLRAAFRIADADKNGYLDEEEFMPLFSTVMAGMVTGLGGGIDYYERPHPHMQWGDEDFHPDTDWQDLFFDLLFAGSAFCGAALLAESLVNHQALEGFIWFLVMFLCLAQQWVMRIHYCSRFASVSLFHAIIVEELEFVCIALATWHIPLENVIKDTSSSSYVGSSLSYSSYGGGGSGDHRRRGLLAGSSYSSSYGGGNDDVVVLTPVDQLRGNVDGCAFGFSVFLGLNCLIYVGRWVEVSTDPLASHGAKSIARFSAVAYSVVALIFFCAAAFAALNTASEDDDYEDETSAWCLYWWGGAHLAFIGGLAYWTAR